MRTWSTLLFSLLKIIKWIWLLHVMARAIHRATSWGSVSIIRFRISEIDHIMMRTGTFLKKIQSIFSWEVKFQMRLVLLQRYMPILYLNQGQLHYLRRSCAWAGNWHQEQGKVHVNTCCHICHFVCQIKIEECLLSILGFILPSWNHVLSWLRTSRA